MLLPAWNSVTLHFLAASVVTLGIAAGVAAVAAGVSVSAFAAARWRLHRLSQALAEGRNHHVAEASASLVEFPGLGSKAALLRAVALVNQGEAAQAQRFLAKLPRQKRPKGAVHHYLQAAIFADQGDEEKALLHLHDCLHLDGKYALLAAKQPDLGPLLDRLPPPDPS